MSENKILHIRLNNILTKKLEHIKKIVGYDSDAECIRFLINSFDNLEKRSKYTDYILAEVGTQYLASKKNNQKTKQEKILESILNENLVSDLQDELELSEFRQAAAEDMLKKIPPLTKEEYNYYMSLPDKE